MTDHEKLRRQLAELVVSASSGTVTVTDALAAEIPLFDLGMDSLGWLRLIDAVELTYGLEIDLSGDDLRAVTLDAIVDRVVATG